MTKRDLDRRLNRLETPAEAEYRAAFRRAKLRVVRHLGVAFAEEEAALLGGGSEAGDAETLIRYRTSLPEQDANREGGALLSWAYREAEDRGAHPWGKEDITELADELERRGWDASGVRYFSE